MQGFVVVSSHKLPYSRRFPSTYTLLHVPKRFAVRDSVCLNCIYEYKKALLPFMKTFWVPRLGSSLIFCDYMKTLLSFGITVLRTVRAGRGLAIYLRGAEDASTIRKTIDNAVCMAK